MPELPDPRSVSAEALHVWRLLAVRAVVDFDLSQAILGDLEETET